MCLDFCNNFTIVFNSYYSIICHFTYFNAMQIPFFKNTFYFFFFAFLHTYKHSFLRFRHHHFPGLHIGFTSWNPANGSAACFLASVIVSPTLAS